MSILLLHSLLKRWQGVRGNTAESSQQWRRSCKIWRSTRGNCGRAACRHNHNNGAISLMCRSNEEGAREEGLEEREQGVCGNHKENGAKRDGQGEGGQRLLQDRE